MIFTLPGPVEILIDKISSPVVSIQAWIPNGSIHDPSGLHGISHMIEHNVFKGTKHFKNENLANLIERVGGEINAYTSLEHTVYHVNLSSAFTDLGIKILSDLVYYPIFPKKEFEKEKAVILEEIKSAEDNPYYRQSRAFFEFVFNKNPYGQAILGNPHAVKHITLSDLKKFYTNTYTTSKIRWIVVGNVEVENVLTTFSKILPKKINHSVNNLSRTQVNQHSSHTCNYHGLNNKTDNLLLSLSNKGHEKYKICVDDIHETYITLSFYLLPFYHSGAFALDLFSKVLGQGNSSFLENKLVFEKQLAHGVSAFTYFLKKSALFMITCSLAGTHKVLETLEEIISIICYNKENLIDNEILERAKLNFQIDSYYNLETANGLAKSYGSYWDFCSEPYYEPVYISNILQVTAEQILRYNKRFFEYNTCRFIAYTNKEVAKHLDKNLIKSCLKKLGESVKPLKQCQTTSLILQSNETQSSPSPFSNFPYSPIVTKDADSGTHLILKTDKRLPLIAIRLLLPGGIRNETLKNNGITNLYSQCITLGSKNTPMLKFMERLDDIGSSMIGISGYNSFGVSAETTDKFCHTFFEMLLEVLSEPEFPEPEIQRLINQFKTELDSINDDPARQTLRLFNETIFQGHPYSMDSIGNYESLKTLSKFDLIQFHQNFFSPSCLQFSVVGNTTLHDLEFFTQKLKNTNSAYSQKHRQTYEQTHKPTAPQTQLPTNTHYFKNKPLPEITSFTYQEIIRDISQTHLVLGFRGPANYHDDRFAMRLISSILSGQGGRLFIKLRETEQMVYVVSPVLMEGVDGGHFGIYLASSPDKAKHALEIATKEIRALHDPNLLSERELTRAKRFLIGNHDIDLQKYSTQAMTLGLNALYGLPLPFETVTSAIQGITREHIVHVAHTYLNLDRAVLTVVHNGKENFKI